MRYAIILLVPLLAVLAACAGGGEPQPTPTPSPAVARPSPTREPTAAPTPTPDQAPVSKIVFMSFDADAQEYALYSVKPDGTSLTKLATLSSEAFDFALSPDATMLAFVQSRDRDSEIYVLTVATGQITNITNTPPGTSFTNEERAPTWSPNGKLLAFKTHHLPTEPGPRDYDTLEVLAPDGAARRVVLGESHFLPNRPVITLFQWSPAGDAFVFRTVGGGDSLVSGHLYIIESAGSGLEDISGRILNLDVDTASWRPDGEAVALVIDSLYLGSLEDGRVGTHSNFQSSLQPRAMAWSPDGLSMALDLSGTIAVIDAQGRNLRVLTEDAILNPSLTWSPDGKGIAYTVIGGPCREGCPDGPLKVVTAENGIARVATGLPVRIILSWLPD